MSQRTALVTGANGGIGRAICQRLREAGHRVLTLDIAGDCDFQVDLAHGALPEGAFDAIDICIANAGIVDTIAPAHTMSAEKWARDIDLNLTGTFRIMQACLRGMRDRRWGRIVAISSVGSHGAGGQIAYAASKAGLHGLVRTIAIENSSRGITANSILPGMIATPKVLGMPQDVIDRVMDQMPMGRFGEPAEIAELVAFLAGERAGYITGQDIAVDGGISLTRINLGRARKD